MSNMITIKLRLKNDIRQEIENFQRKFSNVVRYSFNRFMDGYSRTEVFDLIRSLNNVGELDLTWRREAAKVAESLYLATKKNKKNEKVIFGGRGLFKKRLKGLISREEYLKQRKLTYISCEGSKADTNGNRKFKFDVETLCGSVKLNGFTVNFSCHGQGKVNMDLLKRAMTLASEGEIGITYRLNAEYLYVCFDMDKIGIEPYHPVKGVTLALDVNPNYIGLSIINANDDVIHRQVFDMKNVDCGKGKGRNNKKKYELTEIAKSIAKLCAHYKVEIVGYEKLSVESKEHGKGKTFNRTVNNGWCRDRFINSLRKWVLLMGCKCQEIAPEYSSFIGCIMYQDETDSVAASLELNRRLRSYKAQYIDKTEPKGSVVYPPFQMSHLNRWKESFGESAFDGWKPAYKWFKETKISYRLTYDDWLRRNPDIRPLSYKSFKSRVAQVIL